VQLKKRRARNTAPKRLQTALDKRGPVPDRTDDVEWSTSVDADDLPRLARHLSRTLGGDFSSAVGKAMFVVIASAPDNAEDCRPFDKPRGGRVRVVHRRPLDLRPLPPRQRRRYCGVLLLLPRRLSTEPNVHGQDDDG
jgi:hypothetical protein